MSQCVNVAQRRDRDLMPLRQLDNGTDQGIELRTSPGIKILQG
jgi:hypothetical protein